MRVFVTDCEGPLTRNDNAQEIAAAFIPNGAEFFARLSRYDDYLADVVRKPGYNAGDTLRLIAPFLRAFGLDDKAVEDFSAANVLVVPGADQLLAEVRALMPAFIISTSYTPYIRALCALTGFPFEDCRCTELSLDAWAMPHGEALWLRDWAIAIAQRPLIELPTAGGAAAAADATDPSSALSPDDRETVAELDHLFWTEMAKRPTAAAMIAAVRPVGGDMKLAALEEIVRANGCADDEVMYVGDSITDVPPLAAVREWGGIALSFNGNEYALAAAEFAAASADALPTLELARAFAAGGPAAARALARDWPAAPAAAGPASSASSAGPASAVASAGDAASGAPPALPVVGLLAERRDELAAASRAARSSVRGEPIARLG
jgi:energy-converting hydrogenase A subunit R